LGLDIGPIFPLKTSVCRTRLGNDVPENKRVHEKGMGFDLNFIDGMKVDFEPTNV